MLKTITLKNFVHFKDETVIHLDANKEERDGCNSLNVFVGANFCGKSTIIELIRRCMTDEINLSKTNLCLEDSVAYAVCKFDDEIISGIITEPNPNRYYSATVYKFFIYDKVNDNENETFFRFKSSNNRSHFYTDVLGDTEKKVFRKLLGKETDETSQTDENINYLLNMIKTKQVTHFSQYKPSWKDIENQFIATFPLRGIGIAQWSKSERIQNERNYKEACERAEVISTLLKTKKFDEDYEKEIFEFITYPDVFTFTQNNGHIYVQKDELKFHLLKTSEGIIEAKLTCLLLADTSIKTLCLEEPDRGMHPQMIERLKTVLCKAAYNKTIIVVTHSPIFIDNVTFNNTHVFFRQKRIDDLNNCSPIKVRSCPDLSEVSGIDTWNRSLLFKRKQIRVSHFYTCSVERVWSCPELSIVHMEKMQSLLSSIKKIRRNRKIDSSCSLLKVRSSELSKVSDIEIIRSVLFATKVLLVEGPTDREVVQGIFTEYKKKNLGNTGRKIGEFKRDITTYQVVSVNGCQNVQRVRSFCEHIHLPCLCLMDLDTIVHSENDKTVKCKKSKKKKKIITGFSRIIDNNNRDYWRRYIQDRESLSSFIAHDDSLEAARSLELKENTFIWRHGALENAILSSPELNKIIWEKVGLKGKKLTTNNLKDKLTERLTVEQGEKFYAQLLAVPEIDRFIKFMEKKEYQTFKQ